MHKSFPRRVRKVSFAELGDVGVVLGEELSYFSELASHEPASHEPASHEPTSHEPASHKPASKTSF
jgi:hypothetical protein